MLALRKEHQALRRGVTVHRHSGRDAGILAFSRIDPAERVEYMVVFNTAKETLSAEFESFNADTTYKAIYPEAAASVTTNTSGLMNVTVPAMDYVIYRADKALPESVEAPVVHLNLTNGDRISGHIEICALVKENILAKANFYAKYPGETEWEKIGQDLSPSPYSPHSDVSACGGEDGYVYRMMLLGEYSERFNHRSMPNNLPIEIKAEIDNYQNQTSSAEASVVFDNRFRKMVIHYENGNQRTSAYGIAKDLPYVFPASLKDNVVELFWPADSKYVYLYFDDYRSDNIGVDEPIRLEFGKHFLSNFKEPEGQKGYADIYINNAHDIAGENNFLNDPAVMPPVLFASLAGAAAPFGDQQMFVRGDMNDWGTSDLMEYNSANNAYEAIVTVPAGDQYFRYADAGWGDQVNFGGPFFKKSGMYEGDGSSGLLLSVPFEETDQYQFSFIQTELAGETYRLYRVTPVVMAAPSAADSDDTESATNTWLVWLILVGIIVFGFVAVRAKQR